MDKPPNENLVDDFLTIFFFAIQVEMISYLSHHDH